MPRRCDRSLKSLLAFARGARAAFGRQGLHKDTSGAVVMYSAIVSAMLVGSGVLAIDVGRLVLVRSEMQHACDSAVISATAHIDGSSGGIARATAVATDAVDFASGMVEGSGDLTVASVTFYSAFVSGDPAKQTVTADDFAAHFMRVTLTPQNMFFLLKPVLDLVTGGGGSDFATVETTCVAEYSAIACDITPLMICDPANGGLPDSAMNPANAGRQIIAKQGPGDPLSKAKGNFGLLCPAGAGNCGAKSIADALANPGSGSCGGGTIETKPGASTGPIVEGINARFQKAKKPKDNNEAMSIMGYPKDGVPGAGSEMGNGLWSPAGYWDNPTTDPDLSDHVPKGHGAFGPAGLDGLAILGPPGRYPTRYQMYLYEIGESFAYNTANPGWTLYPVPDPATGVYPPGSGGWTTVNPPQVAAPPYPGWIPKGGVPKNPLKFDPNCSDISDAQCKVRHRTMLVVAVDCGGAVDVKGKTVIEGVSTFVRMFLTEPSNKPPGPADIKAEVIGPEFAASSGVIHANVRLVE